MGHSSYLTFAIKRTEAARQMPSAKFVLECDTLANVTAVESTEVQDAHNTKYTLSSSASSSLRSSLPSPSSSSSSTAATSLAKPTTTTGGHPPATQAAVPQIYQLILTNPGNEHFSGAKLIKIGPISTLAQLKLAIREKLGPAFTPEQDLVLHCAGGLIVEDEASFRAMPTSGKLDVSTRQ